MCRKFLQGSVSIFYRDSHRNFSKDSSKRSSSDFFRKFSKDSFRNLFRYFSRKSTRGNSLRIPFGISTFPEMSSGIYRENPAEILTLLHLVIQAGISPQIPAYRNTSRNSVRYSSMHFPRNRIMPKEYSNSLRYLLTKKKNHARLQEELCKCFQERIYMRTFWKDFWRNLKKSLQKCLQKSLQKSQTKVLEGIS